MNKKLLLNISLIASMSLNIFAAEEAQYIDTGNSIHDYLDHQRRLGNITAEQAAEPFGQTNLLKANVFTIDTRDQETCHKIANDMRVNEHISSEQLKDLCVLNENEPLISIIAQPENTDYGLSFKYSEGSPGEQKLATETRNFIIPGVALMAIFFAMPSEHTGWDNFDASEAIGVYNDKVAAGPVIDTNPWAYNWIGHPYTGATYYTIARHAGFTRASSFGYSFFMSTVYWEYGIEAIAEIPSIQDLIVTPVLGALLGEAFLYAEKQIQNNNGEVMGSKRAGRFAMTMMNPSRAMFRSLDNFFDRFDVEETETYFKVVPPISGETTKPSLEFGVVLSF